MEKATFPTRASCPARCSTERSHRPIPNRPAAQTCSPASRETANRCAASAAERLLRRGAFGQHTRIGQGQRLVLCDEQLLASPLGGIEQFVERRPREGGALAGALH